MRFDVQVVPTESQWIPIGTTKGMSQGQIMQSDWICGLSGTPSAQTVIVSKGGITSNLAGNPYEWESPQNYNL